MADVKRLQSWRVNRWFALCDEIIRENDGMPPVTELYAGVLARLVLKSE